LEVREVQGITIVVTEKGVGELELIVYVSIASPELIDILAKAAHGPSCASAGFSTTRKLKI